MEADNARHLDCVAAAERYLLPPYIPAPKTSVVYATHKIPFITSQTITTLFRHQSTCLTKVNNIRTRQDISQQANHAPQPPKATRAVLSGSLLNSLRFMLHRRGRHVFTRLSGMANTGLPIHRRLYTCLLPYISATL